jgi:hypothetical protein
MFEETLEFMNAIILCYGMQKSIVLHQIIPKAQVWAIIEVITSPLNHVVSTYVMNQSRGHWVLSNALIITITLTMEMEVALLKLSIKLEIFDLFETKIHFLHKNMWLEVIKVIKPFLEFLKSSNARQAHNMIVIMLDPSFKALHIMENFVGCKNVI